MNLIRHFFRLFGRRRPSRPEDIPRRLDAATLTRALEEARRLRTHAVDVQTLSPGELPIPRRADDKSY